MGAAPDGQPRSPVLPRADKLWLLIASITTVDGLPVVTVRIEHERGVVIRPARAGRPIVGPAGLEGDGVESIDLSPTLGCKRGMLFHGIWVVAIDPEDWIVHTVADTIATDVSGICLTLWSNQGSLTPRAAKPRCASRSTHCLQIPNVNLQPRSRTGRKHAVHQTATPKLGFPCRISLANAEVDEKLILVSIKYRATHVIFMPKGT